MKKFLSLALALIMTMSLVTIGTSATFTDDDAIYYSEAVDVMAAISVIGGYADGSFAPDATLTRGAAAKIICNLILGPTTAGALIADAAPFPDVATSHVFAGYIAYCANQGILSGYADGNFVPDGTVTGYQFMKMLLGALGYDASIEGFTGDNWSVNVAKLAISMGLDDGNEDYVGTAAMTREEACLYAFNLLHATMVDYDNNSSVTVGDIVITSSSTAKEVADSDTPKYTTIYEDDGYVQFGEKYFSDLEREVTEDSFGRPVTAWDYDGDDVGSYVDHSDLKASYEGKVTKGEIYTLLGSSMYSDLCDEDASLVVYVDGDEVPYVTVDDGEEDDVNETMTEYVALKSSTSSIQDTSGNAVTGNSSATEVYLTEDEDGNDVVTIVVINTYVVQATADYSTSNEWLKIDPLHDLGGINESYIENDDVYVEDFEEDDYILVTVAEGDIKSAVLAELVSGEVTMYTVESNVYLDGTKYVYNVTVDDTDTEDTGKDASFTVGEEATLVLDQYGNVVYVDSLTASSDVMVFIDEYATSGSLSSASAIAAAYFSDGTYAEITINKVDTVSIDADDVDEKKLDSDFNDAGSAGNGIGWFSFSEKSDGTYNLTTEDSYDATNTSSDTNSDVIIQNSKTAFASGIGSSVKGNSSTVFVIVDEDGDVYSYTGITNVPTVTAPTTGDVDIDVYIVSDDGYAEFVIVFANNTEMDIEGTSTVTDYMMILEQGTDMVVTADDEYYEYDVWMDGEVLTVYIEEDDLEAGVVYKNIQMSGDIITSTTEIGGASDDVTYSGSTSNGYASISRSSDILEIAGNVMIIEDTQVVMFTLDLNGDYVEESVTTAKGIISALSDDATAILANYYAISDDDSEKIETLFLFVHDDAEVITETEVDSRGGDYDDAYADAGLEFDGAEFTVDESEFATWYSNGENGTQKDLLTDNGYYWYGVGFEHVGDADNIELYFDGEYDDNYAIEYDDENSADGVFYIYFKIADTSGNVEDSASWDISIEWYDGDELIAVTTETVVRTVE